MSENISQILNTVGVVAILAALVGIVVGLLERTHRRSRGLSRAPFGLDLKGDRDIVRTLDELRAAGSRTQRPRLP